MNDLLKRCIEGFVIVALVYLLAGCATLSGLGSDLQWIGDLEPSTQVQSQN